MEHLGIEYKFVNIGESVNALLLRLEEVAQVSEQTRVNLPARIRMATLYAIAQSLPNGGRVANTCNRSEDFVGYSTKFGDSAGDFSPLANLMVDEVKQIGHELSLPADLVDKMPSDGLCGKTDEDNLGFTYFTYFLQYDFVSLYSLFKSIFLTLSTSSSISDIFLFSPITMQISSIFFSCGLIVPKS